MNKTKILYFEYDVQNKELFIENKKIHYKKIPLNNLMIYFFGDPKVNNKIFCDNLVKNNFSLNNNFLKKINGEFLIIVLNKKKNLFYLINDRFTSIPLYYIYDNEKLYFSNNYLFLYKKIKKKIELKLNPETFVEFLLFRKLHGNKTFDTKIKYLDFASKLKIDKKLVRQQ